jgi:putative ABC transport system ATP-binding protein
MAEIIRIENLSKSYLTNEVLTEVLFDLSFKITKGEFVALMGPSGSGKSTLMHIMGFLDRPSTGKYFFASEDTSAFTDEELAVIRNQKIGFVFQSFFLLPKSTVLDNVKLPLLYSEMADHDTLAKKALEAVGLSHRLGHFSNQLSGGEKQRVAIARALVNNPEVIFADEPTGNLDSKSGDQVMGILEELNKQGKTIILVTHEQDTANHAERLIKIRDGKLVEDRPITNRRSVKDGELQK